MTHLDGLTLQEVRDELQAVQDATLPALPVSELEMLPEGGGQQMPGALVPRAVVPRAVPPSVLLASQWVQVEREATTESARPAPERAPRRAADRGPHTELPSRHNNYLRGSPEPPEEPRRRAAPAPRPRAVASRSAGSRQARLAGENGLPPDDLEKLQRALYPSLTTHSSRGGRKVAADPRLDPTISPKRAARILANRLSAARSKKRQREGLALAKEREGMEVAELLVHMHHGEEAPADGAAGGSATGAPAAPVEAPAPSASAGRRGSGSGAGGRGGARCASQHSAGSKGPSSSTDMVPYSPAGRGGGGPFVQHGGLNPASSQPSVPRGYAGHVLPASEIAALRAHYEAHRRAALDRGPAPPGPGAHPPPRRPQDPRRYKDVGEVVRSDNAALDAWAREDPGAPAGHVCVFGAAPEASGEVRHFPPYSAIATKIGLSQRQPCLVPGLMLQREDEEGPAPALPYAYGAPAPPAPVLPFLREEEAHLLGHAGGRVVSVGRPAPGAYQAGFGAVPHRRARGKKAPAVDRAAAAAAEASRLAGVPRQDELMMEALERSQKERAAEAEAALAEEEEGRRRLMELMREYQAKTRERLQQWVDGARGEGPAAGEGPLGDAEDDDTVGDTRSTKRAATSGSHGTPGTSGRADADAPAPAKHGSPAVPDATDPNDGPAAGVLAGMGSAVPVDQALGIKVD